MWRVFDTVGQARAYNAQCFAALVRKHAATLTDQEMDDHWDLPKRARIPDLPDSALTGGRFPIYGRNQATGLFNTVSSFTRAWAEPRETADGRWAAPCLDPTDPEGVPEPSWPALQRFW